VKKVTPTRPIVAEGFLNHVQINTIDMTSEPDGIYKYIFHIKDHFSRFSYAEPSRSKTAEEAAACLLNFCLIYGPPAILYSNNGDKFVEKVVEETLKLWPNIRIIHGQPQNPRYQGLVEKENNFLQSKLAAWMEDTNRSDWST
ncbi:20787_t:CDS:2, partial [Gigaspora rosea]